MTNNIPENQLIVPIILWGDKPPTHCISCIHITRDFKTLVTGCNDGQLILWDFSYEDSSQYLVPRCMLFGHTSNVLCLANGNLSPNGNQYIVSASENGEMCLWDTSDGRCIESNKIQNIHTNMICYGMQGHDKARLICNGFYSEILIIDPLNLTIVFSLASKISPNWISSVYVKTQKNEDIVIGLTASGNIKTWILDGSESKSNEPIYERSSSTINCSNSLKLSSWLFDNKTLLVVCYKYWRIYDSNDFTLLFNMENKKSERWLGGSFISVDKIIIWSDHGKGYLYKLPSNNVNKNPFSCNPNSEDFHSKQNENNLPYLYFVLNVPFNERLLCPPTMNHFTMTKGESTLNPFEPPEHILVRGDSQGRLFIWKIKENEDCKIRTDESADVDEKMPNLSFSLEKAWNSMNPPPAGIMDQIYNENSSTKPKITASIYLPLQGSLICGRDDGTIIIMPATQTIMLQFLSGKHQSYDNWPQFTAVKGHSGKVNCLLYPYHEDNRYDPSHLISGGIDFSVCLWDLYNGTLLYSFSVHAGEVTQLIVPPPNCNPRILNCICSVASDHSVALLSIKERKCIMLASRHLFPITSIKWRPLDDFMIVACGDGSVYVWQMETGLLDRVVHGMMAEEILDACDENIVVHDVSINPALHVFRSIKFGNFDAIKNVAARGLQHLTQNNVEKKEVVDLSVQSQSYPLMIQGIKTNPKDQESHVLFFDIESLIVNLLSNEYATMSPNMLESFGLTNNTEYQKYLYLANSPETQHKFSGLISKIKDTAENAAQKLQKADMAGFKSATGEFLGGRKASAASSDIKEQSGKKLSKAGVSENNLALEISQIILSLLHAWGLDADLDRICDTKLGLLRPSKVSCFGMLSKGHYMSLLLPTFLYKYEQNSDLHSTNDRKSSSTVGKHVRISKDLLPASIQAEEQRAQYFASKFHWELSSILTTNHLLAIVSLSKTLMSISCATFISEQERKKKLFRRVTRADSKVHDSNYDASDMKALEAEAIANHQEQVKKGWSFLATLHCVLLPDYIKSHSFKKPMFDMLATRWQDRCLEIREAAQALLLAELKSIGPKGRKQLVEEWAVYLPKNKSSTQNVTHQQYQNYMQTSQQTISNQQISQQNLQSNSQIGSNHSISSSIGHPTTEQDNLSLHSEQDIIEGDNSNKDFCVEELRVTSNLAERRYKKSVAIILLGVIGSEYGQEIEKSKRKSIVSEEKKKLIVEGFGNNCYNLSMQTSSALFSLLISNPHTTNLSIYRSAIDLIGRGFTVWEPYLNISQVLLRLLELCNDSEKLIASMSFGLPLTPEADSCRTARHALVQIATSRPPLFISTLACEIARYNNMQQNAQHQITHLQNLLNKAKPELLRNIDLLIKTMPNEIWDLIIETMDIILHCLDFKHLKEQSLGDVFPSIISKFPNVSYCSASRRIAVGARNGKLAIYELKQPKSQVIAGHSEPITCCAFSPDGKYLTTYSMNEKKLLFWSTATSILGWGNSQIKIVKSCSTAPISESIIKSLTSNKQNISSTGQINNCDSRIARLVWISSKIAILIFSDGSEYKYSI